MSNKKQIADELFNDSAEPSKEETKEVVSADVSKPNPDQFSWNKHVSKQNEELAFKYKTADDMVDAFKVEQDKSKDFIEKYQGSNGVEYNNWYNKVHGTIDYSVIKDNKDAKMYKDLGLHPHIADDVKKTFEESFTRNQDTSHKEQLAKKNLECKEFIRGDESFNDNVGAVMNSLSISTKEFRDILGESIVNKKLMSSFSKLGSALRSETLNKSADVQDPLDSLPRDVDLLQKMYMQEDEKRLLSNLTFTEKQACDNRLATIKDKIMRVTGGPETGSYNKELLY